jgi:hypothetical protein
LGRTLVAVVAVSVWVGVQQPSTARAADEPSATGKHDDPQAAEARRHYEEGTKAFNLGEYPRAVTEFKAAYNAKPDPLLLYNIGQSFRLGGDAAQALFFYRSFLRNMPTAPNRKEVEGRIRALEKQVEEQKREAPGGTAAVTTAPPAATAGGGVTRSSPTGTSGAEGTPPPGDVTGRRPSDAAGGTTTPSTTPREPVAPPPVATEPATPAGPTVDLSQAPTPAPETASSPFYKRWWFWTGVGVVLLIGIGAVAARDKAPSTTYGLHDPTFSAPPPTP